jgi:hypothetical protein
MSIGPLAGLAGSVAGSPLAQTKGSEIERAQHETANQQRRVANDLRADSAAGIGQTDGDSHETNDRDADGRRLWEISLANPEKDPTDETAENPQSKDASRRSGTLLDLTG